MQVLKSKLKRTTVRRFYEAVTYSAGSGTTGQTLNYSFDIQSDKPFKLKNVNLQVKNLVGLTKYNSVPATLRITPKALGGAQNPDADKSINLTITSGWDDFVQYEFGTYLDRVGCDALKNIEMEKVTFQILVNGNDIPEASTSGGNLYMVVSCVMEHDE